MYCCTSTNNAIFTKQKIRQTSTMGLIHEEKFWQASMMLIYISKKWKGRQKYWFIKCLQTHIKIRFYKQEQYQLRTLIFVIILFFVQDTTQN